MQLGWRTDFPEGVWKARIADKHSRDIFFVSLARALGIPARIDEVTRKVQLFSGKEIIDINFRAAEQTTSSKGLYRQIINQSRHWKIRNIILTSPSLN